MRVLINRVIAPTHNELVGAHRLESDARRYRRVVEQFSAAMTTEVLTSVPDTAGRLERLTALEGTDIGEAMFLLDGLHRGLRVHGSVCEFGVAQGATSALIANELAQHAPDRHLWLYDSFRGLPAPTTGDELIDDIEGLGSMSAYEGAMSVPRSEVEARLADVAGWPASSTTIVEGFFDLGRSTLPDRVAFAYVDFDLYQPIVDVLAALHPRTGPGSVIMIDDYGYFSAGAQRAVDEFHRAHPDEYTLTVSPAYGAAFAVLARSG